jgi:hypothetical protein
MPYISQDKRAHLQNDIIKLVWWFRKDGWSHEAGVLNYIITRLIWAFWKADPNYKTWAKISAALTDARDEMYRRVIVPYEDSKIEENGDVYI